MPSGPPLYERVASLEMWRDEHKRVHDSEARRQESSVNRKVVIIAAIIGFVGMVVSGILGVLIGWLLSRLS